MTYYSIIATSPDDIGFEEHLVVLGKGFNVFTVVSQDIERLLSDLIDAGVTVQQVNRLDFFVVR